MRAKFSSLETVVSNTSQQNMVKNRSKIQRIFNLYILKAYNSKSTTLARWTTNCPIPSGVQGRCHKKIHGALNSWPSICSSKLKQQSDIELTAQWNPATPECQAKQFITICPNHSRSHVIDDVASFIQFCLTSYFQQHWNELRNRELALWITKLHALLRRVFGHTFSPTDPRHLHFVQTQPFFRRDDILLKQQFHGHPSLSLTYDSNSRFPSYWQSNAFPTSESTMISIEHVPMPLMASVPKPEAASAAIAHCLSVWTLENGHQTSSNEVFL